MVVSFTARAARDRTRPVEGLEHEVGLSAVGSVEVSSRPVSWMTHGLVDRHWVAVGQATLRSTLGDDSGALWSTSRGAAQRTGPVLARAAGPSARPHVTTTSAYTARIMTVRLIGSCA